MISGINVKKDYRKNILWKFSLFLEHQPMIFIATYDLYYKNDQLELFYMLAQIIVQMNPLVLC